MVVMVLVTNIDMKIDMMSMLKLRHLSRHGVAMVHSQAEVKLASFLFYSLRELRDLRA